MTTLPPRMTRPEASAYLLLQHGIRRKVGTLAKLAVLGGGPAFRKIGARTVAYDVSELDRWADDMVSAPRSNTAQTS